MKYMLFTYADLSLYIKEMPSNRKKLIDSLKRLFLFSLGCQDRNISLE